MFVLINPAVLQRSTPTTETLLSREQAGQLARLKVQYTHNVHTGMCDILQPGNCNYPSNSQIYSPIRGKQLTFTFIYVYSSYLLELVSSLLKIG